MTIARSSILHGWSSRYGSNPRIGGRPVFTRNTSGIFVSQEGEVSTALPNTPRYDWATLNLPNSLTERRKVLTLELARTNNIPWSIDFSNAVWAKTGITPTSGIPDPRGGTSAFTLTATTGAATCTQTMSVGSSLQRMNAIWIRRRTGSGQIYILRSDASTWDPVTITPTWQRLSPLINAASTARWHGVQILVSGDAVDVYNAQQEDSAFITSDIINPGASPTSRAVDSFYWNFFPVPQALMMYLRYVERGQSAAFAGANLLHIGANAQTSETIILYSASSTGLSSAYHQTGVGAVASNVAPVPVAGDTVELIEVVDTAGAVQVIQSINGAAVVASTVSATLAFTSLWSDTRLWLNGGTSSPGAIGAADVKLVKYADVVAATAQGRMDELRALEFDLNGDLI